VIRDIPETARLVVVVGPNGCGKSSLFDALLQWYRAQVGFGINTDMPYYRKDNDAPFDWNASVTVTLAGGATPHRGCLYIRSAYRNDPDFSVSGITRPDAPSESVRLSKVIENDKTVSENYQRLVYDTMAGVYNTGNDAKSVAMLREELIGQIRQSMTSVFGDLVLNNISDPLGAGAFFFDKGNAKGYHYKNLSGGEKAAFDLLLDLHVKKRYFGDAVYCIDEMETHLHTRVQGTLLKEMVKILPDGAQLWVTTHSLGVLRAAQEMAMDNPRHVSVIDFDSVDPDVPRELVPSNLGRISWEKMMSIALDDLSQRISPRVVIICEGSSIGTRRKDFDAEIYNRILGSHAADVLFMSGGSSNQVATNGVSVRSALTQIIPAARILSLCDRDDKSDEEVAQFERSGDIVLAQRNLESYLLADDVIEALVHREGKDQLLAEALQIKNDAIVNSVARGNARNDLKSAAGDIYTGLKRLLDLQRCGNNTDAFLRDTLAPLVVAPMPTYHQLRASVIDRLPG
jgi:energy-coupling factor transporter ATP-binding protein EcfA2